jgi:signal transduction histidine kinase
MQVWINLLLNARDAMAGEGTIQTSSLLDNQQIQISIQDRGEGISEGNLKEIFEPFYTTKDPGKGYGLGLAVCQRIINENHGTIEVVSRAGSGTTFSVTLPCEIEDRV